jgi:uncharacterized membrane protein
MECIECHEHKTDLLPVPHYLGEVLLHDSPLPAHAEICKVCLAKARHRLITQMLGGKAEVESLEERVVQSILENHLVSVPPDESEGETRWPEKLSDNIAKFGGSWRFILSFLSLMMCWIFINSLLHRPFDPYPFILLNLALSCLAALQAPVIMMSQNRQESRDRSRSINDYQINLKAELEIRQLHLKLDQLLFYQWKQLYQLQELQVDLLEELLEKAELSE